jgi:hypothetical protein
MKNFNFLSHVRSYRNGLQDWLNARIIKDSIAVARPVRTISLTFCPYIVYVDESGIDGGEMTMLILPRGNGSMG